MSKRIPRVNQLIKKEISAILFKEIDFPKNILVTVTRVETSIDLNQAKVYISVMPDPYRTEGSGSEPVPRSLMERRTGTGPKNRISNILQTLNRSIYELQQKLNKRLKMRPTPRIKFVEEKESSQAARIEELLEEIKKNG